MFDGKWYQLYVRAPKERNTPQVMQRVDELLMKICAASFVAPKGLPIQEEDGTYEVRVFEKNSLSMAKRVLTDSQNGLEIVREVEND